ncbi:MAG: transporter substrate-binding domain-containing protein [Castellaniella sp.]|uniref:Transporter substrate-binding domain-containing protein n=1 Tax=Castellaniella hirudinis TaxID=1144617 RepID=A0ABV8S004_9BURK
MLTDSIRKTLLCIGLAALGVSTAGAATTLKIGTEGGYPPWSMVDAKGQVTGFDADVGHALCEQMKVKCRFVVQAFDSLIPSLEANRFDMVISGMTANPERGERVLFSVPYALEESTFVLPADSPWLRNEDTDAVIKGLSGKAIGVQSGTTQGAFLRKRNPEIQLKEYDSLDQMQIDLGSGRLYGTFADLSSQEEFVSKTKSSAYAVSSLVIKSSADTDTLGFGIAVGMRKGNDELAKRVNQAMCQISKDGTLKASSMKWFGRDSSNPDACALPAS